MLDVAGSIDPHVKARDVTSHGLDRLARLLRRRYRRSTRRAFVLLAAQASRARPVNTDDMVTLPIPVLRGAP